MVSSALSSHRWDTRDLVLFALFTALIAIGAFIRIPVPFCPFTLQLLFTTLAGLLLGSRRGAASVAVYVFLGLIGLPVFTLFSFHSASRMHPAPLAQSFSKGPLIERIHSLFLSFRLEDPSCAFDAPLLQGPTHGADSLSFPFIPPREFILRLWRGPSPRAYSWSGFTLFSFHSASRIHPAPLARPFFKGLLN